MILSFSSALTTLSLGGDSFLAGLAFGPFLASRRALRLAAVCGACDLAGSWLGSTAATPECALAVATLLTGAIAWALRERIWIVVIPVAMGADNYLAIDPVPSVVAAGACSALLALLGLALGRRLMQATRLIFPGVTR